jgi:hypothetical protein
MHRNDGIIIIKQLLNIATIFVENFYLAISYEIKISMRIILL